MAGILYGAGTVMQSGSIGGTTYAHNRYGNYARARTTPTNPNTSAQQAIRAAIAFLNARWSDTLTALQRAAWGLYGDNVAMKGKFGQTIHLTGQCHYIRSNSIRKYGVVAIIDDAPVIFELPAKDPTLAVTCSEATQQVTTAFDNTMAWAVEDGAFMFLYQGQPQNAQRNFFAGPYKGLAGIPGVDPAGAVTPNVTASKYGIAEGQHQWIYARISRADGRLSERFRDDTFCSA